MNAQAVHVNAVEPAGGVLAQPRNDALPDFVHGGAADDVVPEWRLDNTRDLAGGQAPAGAVERRHEGAPRRRRQVALVAAAARIAGELAREETEVGAAPYLGKRVFR